MKKFLIITPIVLVILCGFGIIVGAVASTDTSVSTGTVPGDYSDDTTTDEKADGEPKIKDGTFKVPTQMKPGRYETVVPEDSFNCYWERLRNTEGDLDSIIANNNASPGQQARVTIKSTDKYFHTSGCGQWEREE